MRRITLRLLDTGKERIGLLPASPKVRTRALGLELGKCLAQMAHQKVVLIEALTAESTEQPSDASANQIVGDWLTPDFAVVRASGAVRPGAIVPPLERLITYATSRGARVLMDLSGLALAADRLRAAFLLDGVCLVAQAKKTTDDELVSWVRDLGARNLGVILIGK